MTLLMHYVCIEEVSNRIKLLSTALTLNVMLKKRRGIVIVLAALPVLLPPANLYLDHNFFSSWCIVFILCHNNPWDKTFQ
jgi:hypothetical protein